MFTKIAENTTLRYAMNLVTPAWFCAVKRKAPAIEVADVQRVYDLFIDLNRSTQFLDEYQSRFVVS
eukprot:TRINITY_DN3281_c0_g1_i1.p1 TRINITY_DN3281_c0_g1~~TRINITY_DN3281_c0_g1_i1.p1  ORF type:complete len:66 (+),score=10.59 TRINITY_DN3281_c0_g1_i1:226-423(+)